ncbi:MAG: hypothetical protein AABX34_04080 [Nanoarchaeota archaeon]
MRRKYKEYILLGLLLIAAILVIISALRLFKNCFECNGCANIQGEEYVALEVKDIFLEYDEEGKVKCAASEDGDKVCTNDSE